MSELIFVRHGQASFGADDYDKLSDLGHAQSRWLGAYFDAHDIRFDRVVRGGLRRHRETAEGIGSATALPSVAIDARLDELHYDPLHEEYLQATGSDAPGSRDDFLTMMPELLSAWEAGRLQGSGEAYSGFTSRVTAAVEDLLGEGGRTLVVTSGGVIGTTIGRVLGLDARRMADVMLNIHNASLHRFEFEAGRLRLSQYNASPHLDPVERGHARTYI